MEGIRKLGYQPFKHGSSYRNDFLGRRTKLDNYRELDCYRDKFR